MNTFYLRLLLAFLVANFLVLGLSVIGTRFFLESQEGTPGFDVEAVQALLEHRYREDGLRGIDEVAARYSDRGMLFHTYQDGASIGKRLPRDVARAAGKVDLDEVSRIALPPPNEYLWIVPLQLAAGDPSTSVVIHQVDLSNSSRRGVRGGPPGRGPGRKSSRLASTESESDTAGIPKASIAVYLSLLIVGIALAGWIVSRSLTAPLRSVQTTINRFAHGDLSARVGEHLGARGDDMGRLAHDFDRMANGVENMLHARDRLLHQLSHEMRSPLARLRFAIELARGQAPDPDNEYLNKADLEIDRLNRLMDEMLQMARAERLPNERPPQTLSLKTLIDDALERVEMSAQARKVALVGRDIQDTRFAAQEDLLERALDNVLNNAIKYSPEHGMVTVAARVADGKIHIEVADQGPGVPANEVAELFEPFYRASNSNQDGYGLGLAIAASAMRAHNGRARAELGQPNGLVVTLAFEHRT